MENSNSKWKDWAKAGLTVIFAIILYRAVQSAGWISGFGVQDQKLTLGISFLIGVAASFSSCLAVAGGMVIAFSEKYQNEKNGFLRGAIWPNLQFHIGRIFTFFVLGGLLGAVGGKINLSGNFVSAYTILIAVVMGWLGLNILGIAPSISSLGLRPPKFILKFWGRLEDTEHKAAPYLLGGITFFLPCGFTQSMQIFALASGSFWAGATSLLLFSLGTAPVLLAVGIGASWGKFKKLSVFQKTAGILILLFAVFTLKSGLALKGVKTGVISNKKNEEQTVTKNNQSIISSQNEQIVRMSVTNRGFEPNTFKIKQGMPVKWIINGVDVSGCTNTIIVPSFDISKNLRYGENVIQFTPQEKGEIAFSCGMGMVRGKFIIEP